MIAVANAAQKRNRVRPCLARMRNRVRPLWSGPMPPAAFSDLVRAGRGKAMRRILRATLNTVNGLRAATASEAAFRQELIALALAIPLALVIATDAWKGLALIGVVLAVLIVELLNTAIEKLADRVTREQDPMIGRAKDMGSAAVGLTLLIAGLVWLLAIWERLSGLL
jgi:diacylglycerol kinase (ATP)